MEAYQLLDNEHNPIGSDFLTKMSRTADGILAPLTKTQADSQTTIARVIHVKGTALHNGHDSVVALHPAPANHGVKFSIRGKIIPALYDRVTHSALCTMLSDQVAGVSTAISTIEHLMAALYALRIDNILIVCDHDEVPILDGSAEEWVQLLGSAGIKTQNHLRNYIKLLKMVEVTRGDSYARLLPYDGFKMDYTIEYDHESIGRQQKILEITQDSFKHELMRARTFCLEDEVHAMRANNKALGGGLHNALVFGQAGVVNPEGAYFADEPVRHKMLDAIGDLSLAGGLMLAHYQSYRGGHALNNLLLRALFADSSNYTRIHYP